MTGPQADRLRRRVDAIEFEADQCRKLADQLTRDDRDPGDRKAAELLIGAANYLDFAGRRLEAAPMVTS